MIPTIEQICDDLASGISGRFTIQQALEWLNIHARSGERELRYDFAIAALLAHVTALSEADPTPEVWNSAVAKLAYATADAMLVERAKP